MPGTSVRSRACSGPSSATCPWPWSPICSASGSSVTSARSAAWGRSKPGWCAAWRWPWSRADRPWAPPTWPARRPASRSVCAWPPMRARGSRRSTSTRPPTRPCVPCWGWRPPRGAGRPPARWGGVRGRGSVPRAAIRWPEAAMGAEALDLYAPWSLQPAAVLAPSRLYRLPPQGLGTSQVESLTSYITRLAAAHTVSVRRLVVQELLPLLGRPHLGGAINNSLSAFWQRDSPAVNGLGALARDWTQALERVTQWPALERLTLRPWAAALPTHGLLRRTRAWCAACYAQWRQRGAVLYEPLQWHLGAVTVCAQHRQVLTERCPQAGCRRPQPPLDSRAQAGHCAFCGAWLGASEPPAAPTAADLDWAVWVAQAVGTLLTAGGAGAAPHRTEVGRRLAARIDEQGGRTHCARVLGLSLSTICQWHQGTHLPQLGSLLRLCAALGTTHVQVLTGHDAAPAPYTGVPPPHAEPARRPRPGAFPTAQIQQRLEE